MDQKLRQHHDEACLSPADVTVQLCVCTPAGHEKTASITTLVSYHWKTVCVCVCVCVAELFT